MQRVSGMTLIANGPEGFKVMYNGQRDKIVEAIKAEMERQQAEHDAEMERTKLAMNAEMDSMRAEYEAELAVERDRADWNTFKRNTRQGKDLNAFIASVTDRRGPVKRALRRIGNAYALVVGTIMCIPEIGQNIGLWEKLSKEEYDEIRKRKAGAACRQRRKEPRIRTRVY